MVHWSGEEADGCARRLRELGYRVAFERPEPGSLLRELAADPPAAIVIDLGRLPSHGRDVALAIREAKRTRGVPLVFVDGAPEKVAGVRALLPDATFASWETIANALAGAIASPPARPVVPPSRLAGYSGTPLPKKLGIKPDTVLALLDAPDGFLATLGELPAGVVLRERAGAGCTLVVWFVRTLAELRRGMARRAGGLGEARLWIAWPKKTSALASDLGEREVREAGLAAGLVDFKVCAIDETWSGLCFCRRKRPS